MGSLYYGYTRVSTDEVRQQISKDVQDESVVKYAAWKFVGMNIHPGGIYFDQCSGGIPMSEREEGSKMLETVEPGDHIIVPKIDRFCRNAADGATVIKELNIADVCVHFLDLNMDTKSPAGRFLMTVMMAFAEMERGRIGERIKEAQARRKDLGLPFQGKPPIGWKIIGKAGKKRYTPDEVERQHALFMSSLKRNDRLSWQQIAQYMERASLFRSDGGLWHKESVRRAVAAAEEGFPLPGDR